MAFSSVDPYSYARPDSAKVVHIHLDLFVDFDETVLGGKAILFIRKLDNQRGHYEIILDIYELDKISITDNFTGKNLEYSITKHVDIVGSKLTIQIPRICYRNYEGYKYEYRCHPYRFEYNYRIQIQYETRKDSPALYWLRNYQTSDGTHPFLITNNKFTYTRGIFPCQDSPSVRFTYTAEISVPINFTVILCGIKRKIRINVGNRWKYIFYELNPMPSYAMIIIAGSLNSTLLCSQEDIRLWAEKKYIKRSETVLANVTTALKIARDICGPRLVGEYNICVLPSNIPEIELQCLSMIFVSSTLLDEDPFYIYSTVARKVAQSWTGGLVTCVNFQHLWLNKSFSTFISKEILRHLFDARIHSYGIEFLERKIFNNFEAKISLYGIDSQWRLVPNLRGTLPKDIAKYVSDEIGYFLLNCLQKSLGGSIIFGQYLKSFIYNFCFKSINTVDWVNHLYCYFDNKHEIIGNVLDVWFYRVNLRRIDPPLVDSHCYLLAEQWITTETFNKFSLLLTKLKFFNILQRIEFLSYLYALPMILPIAKLRWLHRSLPLHEQTCEIQLLLLRLYIKSKWLQMVLPALEFAREYCTPTFACPIFRELYELKETRHLAISGFIAIVEKKCKMIPQTMEEVASILKINLKDIYTLTNEESILHVRTGQWCLK